MFRPVAITIGIALLAAFGTAAVQRQTPIVEVFKSPTCGCCSKWVDYVRANGFTVRSTDVSDLTKIKATHKVPGDLLSCHTATVNGYVIEGHVPAGDIQRLLKERPPIAGIAVPDMPAGSPGMEVPGVKAQSFTVMSFDKDGNTRVFATH